MGGSELYAQCLTIKSIEGRVMRNELVRKQESIVGPERLVRATLATQYRQGRLLTPPDQVALARRPDGHVVTFVDLLVEQRLPWRKSNPLLFGSLIVLAIATALFGAGWLLVRAIAHAVAGIDGPSALGMLVIAGALLLALLVNRSNHRGACPGVAVHCKGCKH